MMVPGVGEQRPQTGSMYYGTLTHSLTLSLVVGSGVGGDGERKEGEVSTRHHHYHYGGSKLMFYSWVYPSSCSHSGKRCIPSYSLLLDGYC